MDDNARVPHRANILQDKNDERVNLPSQLHHQLCDSAAETVSHIDHPPQSDSEGQDRDVAEAEAASAHQQPRGRSHSNHRARDHSRHRQLRQSKSRDEEYERSGEDPEETDELRDQAGDLPDKRSGMPTPDRRSSLGTPSLLGNGAVENRSADHSRRSSIDDKNFGPANTNSNNNRRRSSVSRRYKRTACFVHSLLEVQRGFEKSSISAAQSEPSSRSDSPSRFRDAETTKKDLFTQLSKKEISDMALGVRELSKHLGSARLKLNIHHVLIVTKPGDNQLVDMSHKITEWLLQQRKDKHGNGGQPAPASSTPPQNSTTTNGPQSAPARESGRGYTIYLEDKLEKESFVKDLRSKNYPGKLKFWTQELCLKSPQLFDFVITLGGDGTVLYSSWLFQRIVPPVLSFALGSLGFLTMFDFTDFERDVVSVLNEGVTAALRMRIECVVYRARRHRDDSYAFDAKDLHEDIIKLDHQGEDTAREQTGSQRQLDGSAQGSTSPPSNPRDHNQHHSSSSSTTSSTSGSGTVTRQHHQPTHYPDVSFTVLNDLVVDRGPNPFMSSTELYGDDEHLTSIAADGVVISTPTGSTAYSLSAGGPLCHPEIPAILISPICPHTLSFRPLLVPDSMTLRVAVGYDSRSTAWASFDGRNRVELRQGDYVRVTASRYPFPTCLKSKQTADWFESISTKLNWNERKKQKSV
ncbi:hypothetical protein PYCC9005_002591 [Savitreella phatthalungensis]